MMTANIPFCRVNGLFSHFSFDEAAPESFRGKSRREKDWRGDVQVYHERTPEAFPIQFNHMLVEADQLPAMQDCVMRMRGRDDLGSTKVTLKLARPELTRTELAQAKLTRDELPDHLRVDVWAVGPSEVLQPLSVLLALTQPEPDLPEIFVKSVFMHGWVEASPHNKMKEKPMWMEVRGVFLAEHDTMLVYDPSAKQLLHPCEDIVRKWPRTGEEGNHRRW